MLNLGELEEDSHSVAHFATLHVIFYFHKVLDELDVARMQESEQFGPQVCCIESPDVSLLHIRILLQYCELL